MPILDHSYITLSAQERLEFRTTLLTLLYQNISRETLREQLKKQDEPSLTQLHKDITQRLSQSIFEQEKKRYEIIQRNTHDILFRKQQNIPLAYDKIFSGLGHDIKYCLEIIKNENEPYCTLSFHESLRIPINDVLKTLHDSPKDLILHTTETRIDIDKSSIQGNETYINQLLQQSLNHHKITIMSSIKQSMQEQHTRFTSNSAYLLDKKLQELSRQAQKKIDQLETLTHNPETTIHTVLTEVNSASIFHKKIELSIMDFRSQAKRHRHQQQDIRRRLDVILESPTLPKARLASSNLPSIEKFPEEEETQQSNRRPK